MDYEKKESPEDFGESGADTRKRWLVELKTYEKTFSEWEKLSAKIYNRYAARTETGKSFVNTDQKRFNVLWSNSQVLRPLLYARTPKPMVERRFKDSDKLARLSSECWQREIEYEIKQYKFDSVMEAVRDDYLLAGRGVARVFHNVEYGLTFDPTTGQTIEVISDETARAEYVHFQDFRHGPGRTWVEVPWVAFRSFLTREELIKRFGEIGQKVKLNHSSNSYAEKEEIPEDCYKKAEIWEVWNKADKKVYWISEGYSEPLDIKEDPLGLTGFFPCPEPLYATLTHGNLVPTPDYLFYISQAQELDELTDRISKITRTIKAILIRDGSLDVLDRVFSESAENDVIAANNLRQLVKDGGINAALFSLPVQDKIEVLIQLYEARSRVTQEIYEITGLSDIIRGASDASETATAQQIKGQYANLRLSNRQQSVQEFAAKLISLKGEIIAEKFEPERQRQMSGYDYMIDANPEDPNEWPSIIDLLTNDPLRNFRVTVETDSTLAVDEAVEKERRSEFLNTVGGFLGQTIPLAQQTPQLAPLISEMIKFSARSFTAGRQLEDVLEQSLQQFQDALMQPPPDPMQDPQVQLKMQEMQAKYQADTNKANKQFTADMAKVQVASEKNRVDLITKGLAATNKETEKTVAQVAPHTSSGNGIDLNINISANPEGQRPVKKRIVMQRLPTGELVGESFDIDDISEANTDA